MANQMKVKDEVRLRILEALLEKAKEAISEEKAKNLSERLLSGEFSLKDLYDQMVALRKMGPLTKLIQMIPGFGQLQLPKELIQVQEEKLKKWKIAMDSMTKEELENPEVIDQSRIKRISRGSGIDEKDIRELIKHYKLAKKLMKRFKGKEGMKKLYDEGFELFIVTNQGGIEIGHLTHEQLN